MMMNSNDSFQKSKKVSGELFSLTYGALVSQLIKSFNNNIPKVNDKLESMGASIGCRLVDEVLAKSKIKKCVTFKDAINSLVTIGFRMYWGNTVPKLVSLTDGVAHLQFLMETPLEDFTELPPSLIKGGLKYSNILIGAIKGAFEAIGMKVSATFVKDRLIGDDCTEIRVELLENMKETLSTDYNENE